MKRIPPFLKTSLIAGLFVTIMALPPLCFGAQEYKFVRLFPNLKQPWYFFEPAGIAISGKGHIYITDTLNHRIQRFAANGHFINAWGSLGNGAGDFNGPVSVVTDAEGFIYVLEKKNARIQKFSSGLAYVTSWGGLGAILGRMGEPSDMTIDGEGFIYVADTLNYRIQKFDSEGRNPMAWGGRGDGDGQFQEPVGIAYGNDGFIYVVDKTLNCIKQFTTDGVFRQKWGSTGANIGQFNAPRDIAFDKDGNIYVTEEGNQRVQKFDSDFRAVSDWSSTDMGSDAFGIPGSVAVSTEGFVYMTDVENNHVRKFTTSGKYVSTWDGKGDTNGFFNNPSFIETTSDGFYVSDTNNHRIQKFDNSGNFIDAWGTYGTGDGQFNYPFGVAADADGNIYVADTYNHRIQKFDSNYTHLKSWGGVGTGNGQFDYPYGIAVDQNTGTVYVADLKNSRVQKFSAEGDFEGKWGSYGNGDGQFYMPCDVAIDSENNVYVTDMQPNVYQNYNNRVQKFDSDGKFILEWGGAGSADGYFYIPTGITVDDNDSIYVADRGNNRVQLFDKTGNYIGKMGEVGSSAGSMRQPMDVGIGSSGQIIVTDSMNNRIQFFRKGLPTDQKMKAVIVAGGKGEDDALWEKTHAAANYAFRTLIHQGFTKETIYYISALTNQDVDENGDMDDDIDAEMSADNVKYAITEWAADADNVVIYLTDHGRNKVFVMTGATELQASQLDAWLDVLQQTMTGQLVIVYDACFSGSFIETLQGNNRITVTSTDDMNTSLFNGAFSFSNHFWTQIFDGMTVGNTFDVVEEIVWAKTGYQAPVINDNGNEIGNEPDDGDVADNVYIGNGVRYLSEGPTIGEVTFEMIPGTNSGVITAKGVTDPDGVGEVSMVIRPPNYTLDNPKYPVSNLPMAELVDYNGIYQGQYDDFSIPDDYLIVVYATDMLGNTSSPKIINYTVSNPLHRRAILVVGGSEDDPLLETKKSITKEAYNALRFQGYEEENIHLICAEPIDEVPIKNIAPSFDALQIAITEWAVVSTQDVVLYMIGGGDENAFHIAPDDENQYVSGADLNSWLNTLQPALVGPIVIVYDAPDASGLLSNLQPYNYGERFLLSSTKIGQIPCYVDADGAKASYSHYFWSGVLSGEDTKKAHFKAENTIKDISSNQQAGIDIDGDGQFNELSERMCPLVYYIGNGLVVASAEPEIYTIVEDQSVGSETSATIWIEMATSPDDIQKVTGMVMYASDPSDSDADSVTAKGTFELTQEQAVRYADTGTTRYSGVYDGFDRQGAYDVWVYVMDGQGNLSEPRKTTIYRAADSYEPDDAQSAANVIPISSTYKSHNFYTQGDADWMKFYGLPTVNYCINVRNNNSNACAAIEVYTSDGALYNDGNDLFPYAEGCGLNYEYSFTPEQEDIFYIKVYNYDLGSGAPYGEQVTYDISVNICKAPDPGKLTGYITDTCSGDEVIDAKLKTSNDRTALSEDDGSYELEHEPDISFTLTITADGYDLYQYPEAITLEQGENRNISIEMEPETGCNLSGTITGTVIDACTEAGIPGAHIETSSGKSATADTEGNYSLSHPPAKNATITVTETGYVPKSQVFSLSAGETVNFEHSLRECTKIYDDCEIDLGNVLSVLQRISGFRENGVDNCTAVDLGDLIDALKILRGDNG